MPWVKEQTTSAENSQRIFGKLERSYSSQTKDVDRPLRYGSGSSMRDR